MAISQRKLASYVAERILAGDEKVLDEVAGLLVVEKREREIDLLVRDVEAELARRGTVVATVESARKLTEADLNEIKELLAVKNAKIREVIKPELIGGFKLVAPTGVLDATILKKLNSLRAQKI